MQDQQAFITHVLGRAEIAEDTVAFTQARPSDFTFEAGQYVSLTLHDFEATEEDDGERMLSLASAPQDDHLVVAMRMRDSAFKRALRTLRPDQPLTISPAMGDIVLGPDTSEHVVLIAGGIGITPFYSMIRDVEYRLSLGATAPRMTLLYGNRAPATCAWQAEIDRIARDNDRIDVIHVFSENSSAKSADGQRAGLIDAALIQSALPDYRSARYFVVGPPAMVASLQDCLDECEVPWDRVSVEFFAGY
jgi:ferredoxin-NADP reductase